MKKYTVHFISILLGVGLWTVISKTTGKSEAWDSGIYFSIGVPFLFVSNLILGMISPKDSVKWGLISTFSQIIPLAIFSGEVGGLWLMGLLLFFILSLPNMLANIIGSFFNKKLINKENKTGDIA